MQSDGLFVIGNVLKAVLRTEQSPLFVMVCYDYEESDDSFRAVALLDKAGECEISVAYTGWDKFQRRNPDTLLWIQSSFREVADAE